MFCANTRPGYQVSVYRTIGPLVLVFKQSSEHVFYPKTSNLIYMFMFYYIDYPIKMIK